MVSTMGGVGEVKSYDASGFWWGLIGENRRESQARDRTRDFFGESMTYEKLECTRSNEESEAYWTDDVVLMELSL